MAKPPFIFDDEARSEYLEDFSKTNEKLGAAKRLGVPMRVVRSTYDTDPEFAEAYDEAKEIYAESLRSEVHRRGTLGVEEPVYQQGMLVGHITKYSDALLLAENRVHSPEYNDKRQTEVTITGGVLLTAAPPTTNEAWIASGKAQEELPGASDQSLLPAPTVQTHESTDIQALLATAAALDEDVDE